MPELGFEKGEGQVKIEATEGIYKEIYTGTRQTPKAEGHVPSMEL